MISSLTETLRVWNLLKIQNCISQQFMIFNYTECSACPHECTRQTFDKNVEYGKNHEPIYRTLQKFSLSTGKQGEILP